MQNGKPYCIFESRVDESPPWVELGCTNWYRETEIDSVVVWPPVGDADYNGLPNKCGSQISCPDLIGVPFLQDCVVYLVCYLDFYFPIIKFVNHPILIQGPTRKPSCVSRKPLITARSRRMKLRTKRLAVDVPVGRFSCPESCAQWIWIMVQKLSPQRNQRNHAWFLPTKRLSWRKTMLLTLRHSMLR